MRCARGTVDVQVEKLDGRTEPLPLLQAVFPQEVPGMPLCSSSCSNIPKARQFTTLALYCTGDILFSIVC